MSEDTVEPQIEEEIVDQPQEDHEEQSTEPKETNVPLSALQKERRKRQEIEFEMQLLKEHYAKSQAPKEEDDSSYEPVTKGDISKYTADIERKIEEKSWVKENPEKKEIVDQDLAEFLKQRPHLVAAIQNAPNRYSEAWALMNAFSPKQPAKPKPTVQKRDVPGSPAAVPKGAAMNEAVDVMTMSDEEFSKWRQAQRKKR